MKNLITYLKALWSWGANSQSSDVSHDCRLTVGSPSGMTAKLQVNSFMRFAVVLTLIFTIGVGNVWGADVTGTINFGNNGTKINTGSVTGKDSQGNTWTITTAGTTSFTQSTDYSQVGSSKKPATSITFTTTLPSAQTISSMSAKFGGFSSTAGTITLKVGDNSIGTGSLNETSNVTVSSTDATKSGTVLTVTVTGISKAVNCYYISYTYSTGGGGCSAPEEPTISGTESYTAGGTISLTASCASGTDASTTYAWYKGADWATARAASPVQAASTSGATFTKASCTVDDEGTYWCEASNGSGCEAHNSTGKAITVSAGGGGGGGTEYVLVTSTKELEAGANYVIGSSDATSGYFMSITDNATNRKLTGLINISNDHKITATSEVLVLQLGGSTGAWTFHTVNYAGTAGYLASAASGNKNYCRVTSDETTGTISFSGNAAVINLNPHTSRKLLSYNSSVPCFACYSSGQAAVYLYKQETSCDNKVTISKGSETNGTFELNKTGEQNACDALSVTVTPSPAEHFHVASVSATDPATTGTAGAAVNNGDGTWTITYSANAKGASTVNVTFEEDPQFTVNWYVNGSIAHSQTGYEGATLTSIPTPTSSDCDGSKVFVGWYTSTYSHASVAPAYVSPTTIPNGGANYYAVFATADGEGGTSTINFEGESSDFTDWTFNNFTSNQSGSITAHGGSKYGTTGGKTTGYVKTNSKIASPTSLSVFVSKQSSNTNTSTWYIKVSSDGSTWSTVASTSATSMSAGDWVEMTADLRSYSDVYVELYYSGSTAVRNMDDLVLSYGNVIYSNYSTSCVACANNVTISKGTESNGTFTLSKSGLQATCNGGCAITVTPTPAEHYRVKSVTASNPTTGTATVTGPVNNEWTVTYSENSNGTSTVNVTFEAIPTYTITLDPSAPANGTTYLESAGTTSVTLDEGIICNLWTVPDDCYSLSSITITPADGYSELEANGENQWQILGITKDLSVAVVYTQRAQYTVTLDAGTGSVTGSTSITQSNCGNITLPAASPSDACATDGWEFAGWSRTKVNTETTSAPVLIPAGSFAPTATETLYAVYKQGSGAAESYWVKAKDDSKLAAGDSVIIAASEYDQAMSTNQKTANRGQASITKSTNGDTLTAISANVDKFILSAGSVSGTFSFYDPTSTIGYLVAASSSSNDLKTKGSIDANASWEINITSATGVASIVAQGTFTRNVMRYNSNSSLFACYSSASQDDLCLYTKAMGSANTYFSSPSCTPCVSAAASLSSSAISMTTGKSSVITLTSDNTSAVTATSSNTEVATVSVSGKNITVNGIAEGEATVIIQQVREGVDASDHCEVYFEVSISVTTATIEIIEWEREAVTIEYDGDPTASVILGKEVEHGSKDAKVATELFFSKYFEAAGEDKLLGIFNGTPDTIDLSKYTIKNNLGGNDALTSHALTPYGNTPGKIAPQEEIIFYRFGQSGYSRNCIQNIEGHKKWNEITWEGMKFSGRYSIGLYKKDRSNNDSIIDIIGATYSQAVGGHSKGDLVLLNKVGGGGGIKPSWGDDSGFNAEGHGDNISTDDLETNYGLSTNRCLLVRKNTVTSGADAVRLDTTSYNPNTDPDKCAAAFQTLCTEWGGVHVPEWEDKKTATCNGMGYVAGFNYSDYYVTMETFSDNQTIGGYGNGDGTYTIPLPHLDTLACKLIRIQLAKEGNVIASSDPKVPIVVDADMSTNSTEFYKHSIDTCKVCDVVVRDKATLTKATTGADNDRAELQNITVYSGSHLVIPSGATDLRAKSIVLRSLDDTVSTASFTGGMTFKDKGYRVYHSKRVKQDRWYWISLPYTCSTSKITWQDGTKATIGTDFHLKYYDGAQRAATQQGGCWKEYTGSTIQPGVGYILSVEQRVGHTYRELIFPMDTISEGEATKEVPVDDYGAGESITPNHKGWNLVGNPYMTYYQKNKINAGDKNLPALTVGKLIPRDSIDAANPLRTIHTYTIDVSGNNNAPFITVPKDQGNSEYEQKLIMDYDLPPFISYFVQIGNNTPVATQQYVNFAKADLTNTPSNLLDASYVRKRAVEEEVDPLESVLVTLRMKNHEQEADETTFIISDQYSNDYEIGSDLGKWFGDNYKDYTKPVLYSKAKNGDKLVFYSLPDASAEQWIPLGFWGGNVTQPITFSLRRNNRKLDYVESVILHDKTMNIYTELLENDYSFTPSSQTKLNGSRFEVKVILNRPKADVPTGTDNIIAGLYAYASGSQKLTVVGLPEKATIWIYDALGRLIINEDTSNYMRTYDVQGTGVYFVRVNSAGGQQTLRTIVK